MDTVVRMPAGLHAAVQAEVGSYAERELETFLFLTLARVETPGRLLYLARSVVVLEEAEAVREGLRTFPTETFCRRFYGTLKAAGVFAGSLRVGAVHSHPFARGPVSFSSTDLSSFANERKIFAQEFGGGEFVGLVVNRDCSAFDGLVVGAEGLLPVDAIQVVGPTFRQVWRSNGQGAR